MSQEHGHPANGVLLTDERNELAICVDADPNLRMSPQAISNITRALENVMNSRLSTHPKWSEIGYDQFPLRVAEGCPSSAFLLESQAKHPAFGASEIDVPQVEDPSDYRLHLYIVSPETVNTQFGAIDIRTAPQEMLCNESAHHCVEVTSAVYLTIGEAFRADYLEERITRALALNLEDWRTLGLLE